RRRGNTRRRYGARRARVRGRGHRSGRGRRRPDTGSDWRGNRRAAGRDRGAHGGAHRLFAETRLEIDLGLLFGHRSSSWRGEVADSTGSRATTAGTVAACQLAGKIGKRGVWLWTRAPNFAWERNARAAWAASRSKS